MTERIISNFESPDFENLDRAMGDDNIEHLMIHLAKIDHGFLLGR